MTSSVFLNSAVRGINDALVDSGYLGWPNEKVGHDVSDQIAEKLAASYGEGADVLPQGGLDDERHRGVIHELKTASDRLAASGHAPDPRLKVASVGMPLGERAAKVAAEAMDKIASGSLSDVGQNTPEEAAAHDQMAALDLQNRPQGKYQVPMGQSDMPDGPANAREMPHPEGPSTTVSIANSLTEHSQKAAAQKLAFGGGTYSLPTPTGRQMAMVGGAAALTAGAAALYQHFKSQGVDDDTAAQLAQHMDAEQGGGDPGQGGMDAGQGGQESGFDPAQFGQKMSSVIEYGLSRLPPQQRAAAVKIASEGSYGEKIDVRNYLMKVALMSPNINAGAKALIEGGHALEHMNVRPAIGAARQSMSTARKVGVGVAGATALAGAAAAGRASKSDAPKTASLADIAMGKVANDGMAVQDLLAGGSGLPEAPPAVDAAPSYADRLRAMVAGLRGRFGGAGPQSMDAAASTAALAGHPEGMEVMAHICENAKTAAEADAMLCAVLGDNPGIAKMASYEAVAVVHNAFTTKEAFSLFGKKKEKKDGEIATSTTQDGESPATNEHETPPKMEGKTAMERLKAAAAGSLTNVGKNTETSAAETDDFAKLDLKNRGEGAYKVQQGGSAMPDNVPGGKTQKHVVPNGVEMKNPNTLPAKTATDLSDDELAYIENFQKTASEYGPYLPMTMSQAEKLAEVRTLMAMPPSQRSAHVRSLLLPG